MDQPAPHHHGNRRGACLPYAAAAATENEPLEVAAWSLVHVYALLGFGQPHTQSRRFANMPGFTDLLTWLINAPDP